MTANPRVMWTPTAAEALLVKCPSPSPSESQIFPFDASAPSQQITGHPPPLFTVHSGRDRAMSPKSNDSPFQLQFSDLSTISASSATSQTTFNDNLTMDSAQESISPAHSFSVPPIPASSSTTFDKNALFPQQPPSSSSLGTISSVHLASHASVSICASEISSPASAQASILSCPISGCPRTFTHRHEYKYVDPLYSLSD